MKTRNLLVLLSIVLFFIGCNKTRTSVDKMEFEEFKISHTKFYEDNPKYANYKFDISIQLPKCLEDTVACRLRKTIIESLFNVNMDTTDLGTSVNLYMLEKTDFFQEPGVSHLKEDRGSNHMWTHLNSNFVYIDKTLCSYIINEEYYTGGAHPNKLKYYFVYDFTLGKKLNTEDIFIPNIKDNLSLKEILLNQMMKQEKAKQISDLNLFDVESSKDFIISPIVYFDSVNLIFSYGDYDIRAYVYGPTEIKVPIKEAKQFLREDFKKRHYAE